MQMQSYSSSTTPLLTDDEKENLIIIPTYSYDNKLNKELTEVCDYFRAKVGANHYLYSVLIR